MAGGDHRAQGGADEDLRPFYETSEEAMADHWGYVPRSYEEWRERRERSNFDPSLWFLALDDEEPAGAVLCSVSDGIGWIDTLAVRRPWRRRGLGFALLTHAFRELYARGCGEWRSASMPRTQRGRPGCTNEPGCRSASSTRPMAKNFRAGIELTDVDEA